MASGVIVFSVLLFALLGAWAVLADFQDIQWGWFYIYHADHSLFLVIRESNHACYFAHVDEITQRVINNCHKDFIEQKVRQTIESTSQAGLTVSSMADMRDLYSDVLADYRCVGKQIYRLAFTFPLDYIHQCLASGK